MKSDNTRASANATVALTAAALVALFGMVTAPATFAEDVPYTFLVPVDVRKPAPGHHPFDSSLSGFACRGRSIRLRYKRPW